AVSIRLDSDILDWFKSQGKGYQSTINNVLRTYINHQQTISK
ncbi:MAG: BrnA antitoxin family protein, partial [Chitinophagaceae bacterium]|nr:BrnA antitoxin family protein [Chitinophagaceae bacterium]